MSAARELQNHGYQVVVLEGRDRIGGRIWTSTKWNDIPLDLGASWIHGLDGNPLTELAKQANSQIVETSYESNQIYDVDGKELSEAKEQRLDRLRDQLQQAIETAQDADEDTSLRRIIDRLQNRLGDNDEIRQFLNFLASSDYEQEYTGSVEKLSAHWFDSVEEFDGEDGLFPGGFQQIVNFLAEGLTIKTNQIVQRIEWNKQQVRVTTSAEEFTADQVVVTLPLGVLKAGRVEFCHPAKPITSNGKLDTC